MRVPAHGPLTVFQIQFFAARGQSTRRRNRTEHEVHDEFVQSRRTGLADPFVLDGLSDRDVGALWLLRDGRAAGPVHDRQADFTDSHATLTWGAFTALVYASPSIGGWIGDKILGARRTMIFGAGVLAVGYFMLALPNEQLNYMYASLGVIVVGNGLFKANAANLVRRIYEGDDARIDSAFTIYYMAVNIGSTVSMLATPWIKDHWGWHTAFAVCCAGMLLSVLNYFIMFRTLAHIGSAPDAEPIRWKRVGAVALGGIVLGTVTMFVLQHKAIAVACVYTAGVAILAIFGYMLMKCERSERSGLIAALILTAQVILFFVFYVQMSTSLTLFALRNVDPRFMLFGRRCSRGAPRSSRRSIRSGSWC